MFDKIWEKHVVMQEENSPAVLYIDAHLIHEVTTPQAFDGLRKRGIQVHRTDKTWATEDHNIPTKDQNKPIREELSRRQVEMLRKNVEEFGIRHYGIGHPYQGIVHMIGPELGITKPGMTIVCGDSHTSTHGAFGSIAFGIGTSEVEEVLATQCILQYKPKTMRVTFSGKRPKGVTAKDLILYLISELGTDAGTGYACEYAGEAIEDLSMEERMTICNMSIEWGARTGMVAPDQKTYDWVNNREFSPKGAEFDDAVKCWEELRTDTNAVFDKEYTFDVTNLSPRITYGTNPGMGIGVDGHVPTLADMNDNEKESFSKALAYMGLTEGQQMLDMPIDYVFIGSCTNARLSDLQAAASIVKGKKVMEGVIALVVPGSAAVKKAAEADGTMQIFREAGFDVRDAGCSACLGMNDDKVPAGKYCVSTSNRNFQGRQGPGSRTILASPLTAAASAIEGKIVDVRNYI